MNRRVRPIHRVPRQDLRAALQRLMPEGRDVYVSYVGEEERSERVTIDGKRRRVRLQCYAFLLSDGVVFSEGYADKVIADIYPGDLVQFLRRECEPHLEAMAQLREATP